MTEETTISNATTNPNYNNLSGELLNSYTDILEYEIHSFTVPTPKPLVSEEPNLLDVKSKVSSFLNSLKEYPVEVGIESAHEKYLESILSNNFDYSSLFCTIIKKELKRVENEDVLPDFFLVLSRLDVPIIPNLFFDFTKTIWDNSSKTVKMEILRCFEVWKKTESKVFISKELEGSEDPIYKQFLLSTLAELD